MSIRQRIRNASQALPTTFEPFDDSERTVLTHGDLGPGNVLWTPEPVLIDWEYTRLGDRADEIAYFFDQNRLSERQRQAFWDGYRESISRDVSIAAVMHRVEWWEPVTLLGSTLWWTERWIQRTELEASGGSDPALARDAAYYQDHVTLRLDRLEAWSGANK